MVDFNILSGEPFPLTKKSVCAVTVNAVSPIKLGEIKKNVSKSSNLSKVERQKEYCFVLSYFLLCAGFNNVFNEQLAVPRPVVTAHYKLYRHFGTPYILIDLSLYKKLVSETFALSGSKNSEPLLGDKSNSSAKLSSTFVLPCSNIL